MTRGRSQEKFFHVPLAPAGPEFHEVTLDNLARFFGNPCRYLLNARLGIALPEGVEELEDDEPFVPDVPARKALAARMLPRLLAGESLADLRAAAHAGIEYPPGRLGDLEREQELQRLAHFAGELAPALTEARLRTGQRDPRFHPRRRSGGASPAGSATCAARGLDPLPL